MWNNLQSTIDFCSQATIYSDLRNWVTVLGGRPCWKLTRFAPSSQVILLTISNNKRDGEEKTKTGRRYLEWPAFIIAVHGIIQKASDWLDKQQNYWNIFTTKFSATFIWLFLIVREKKKFKKKRKKKDSLFCLLFSVFLLFSIAISLYNRRVERWRAADGKH